MKIRKVQIKIHGISGDILVTEIIVNFENRYGEKPKELIMVPYRDPTKDEEKVSPENFY